MKSKKYTSMILKYNKYMMYIRKKVKKHIIFDAINLIFITTIQNMKYLGLLFYCWFSRNVAKLLPLYFVKFALQLLNYSSYFKFSFH